MQWIFAQQHMILPWQLVRPWTLHQRNRSAHMAATCHCRLACDLTCTMVRAFCLPGPDALFQGRFHILSLQAATKYMELMRSCCGIDLSSLKTENKIKVSTGSAIPCLNLHECSADLVKIFLWVLRWKVGISIFLHPIRQWWSNQFRFAYDNNEHSCRADNAPYVVVVWIRHKSNFINRSKFWTMNQQTNVNIEFAIVKSSLLFC